MTVFNIFSKGFGGLAGANQTSRMELFAIISKRLYFRRKLRLRCLIIFSYANLFINKQKIINRLLKSIIRVAEIAECVCNYADGILQNLQSLTSY